MRTRFFTALILCVLGESASFAADIPALKELFTQKYETFYEPRFCGRNTARFVSEASRRNIDLSNSYVLKIEGAGFLETSGFYTRAGTNERQMLGYFHVVFVADHHVFDFDLAEPLVLKLEDYIRLQFTPPYEPFPIFGIAYRAKEQLAHWTATGFDGSAYIRDEETKAWEMKFPDFVDLDEVMNLERAH